MCWLRNLSHLYAIHISKVALCELQGTYLDGLPRFETDQLGKSLWSSLDGETGISKAAGRVRGVQHLPCTHSARISTVPANPVNRGDCGQDWGKLRVRARLFVLKVSQQRVDNTARGRRSDMLWTLLFTGDIHVVSSLYSTRQLRRSQSQPAALKLRCA
jgi:hypothetical protein